MFRISGLVFRVYRGIGTASMPQGTNPKREACNPGNPRESRGLRGHQGLDGAHNAKEDAWEEESWEAVIRGLGLEACLGVPGFLAAKAETLRAFGVQGVELRA